MLWSESGDGTEKARLTELLLTSIVKFSSTVKLQGQLFYIDT